MRVWIFGPAWPTKPRTLHVDRADQAAATIGSRVATAFALILIAFFAGFASASEANDSAGSKQSRKWHDWTPSLAVTFGVYFVDYVTDLESTVRDSARGSDVVITPFVDGVIELMSPALELPTAPQIFIQGSVGPSFGQDVTSASEGALAGLEFPDSPFYGEGAIQGTGSQVVVETQSLTYGARIGLAFSTTVLERTVRWKPSIGWWRYTVKVTGEVQHVRRVGFIGPNTIISMSGTETRSYNSVGPGFEIEVDLDQNRGLGISAFTFAYGHYILHDRNGTIRVSASTGDTARFGYKTDSPWIYRVGFGVRVSWLGD
jgi:hypothetical protein